jgi:hypothetical protein
MLSILSDPPATSLVRSSVFATDVYAQASSDAERSQRPKCFGSRSSPRITVGWVICRFVPLPHTTRFYFRSRQARIRTWGRITLCPLEHQIYIFLIHSYAQGLHSQEHGMPRDFAAGRFFQFRAAPRKVLCSAIAKNRPLLFRWADIFAVITGAAGRTMP